MYAGALPRCSRTPSLVAGRRGTELFFASLAMVSVAVALETGPFTQTGPRPASSTRSARPDADPCLVRGRDARGIRLQQLLTGDRRGAPTDADRGVGGGRARRPLVVGSAPTVARRPDGGRQARVRRRSARRPTRSRSPPVLRWLAFAAGGRIAVFARWGAGGTAAAGRRCASSGSGALDLLTLSSGYNPAIAKEQASPPEPPGSRRDAPAHR